MLLTSAPVAIRRVATPMLPLDLHVLSLSLAFILSQDQTLRCVYLVCLFFSEEKGTSATHKPEAVPLRLHALVSLVSMTAVMLSPVTIGILTGDPRNHLSLSLTCLSIFLIANMSKISLLMLSPRFQQGVKKTAQLGTGPREPKSDAKLQPLLGLCKYFHHFFSKKRGFFEIYTV